MNDIWYIVVLIAVIGIIAIDVVLDNNHNKPTDTK
jgi:hypothetical protein